MEDCSLWKFSGSSSFYGVSRRFDRFRRGWGPVTWDVYSASRRSFWRCHWPVLSHSLASTFPLVLPFVARVFFLCLTIARCKDDTGCGRDSEVWGPGPSDPVFNFSPPRDSAPRSGPGPLSPVVRRHQTSRSGGGLEWRAPSSASGQDFLSYLQFDEWRTRYLPIGTQ